METSNLKLYFGTRNGITLNPIKNVNYTDETIKTMPTRLVADNITKKIIYKMPITTRPFDVFEANGGIGGYTLSFASNPSIKTIYSFESRPEYNKILRKNIEDYNFTNKVAVGDNFGVIPKEYSGNVLFTDETNIGGFKIEDWLPALTHLSIIVIKAPKDFILNPVDGFTYITEELENENLIFAMSDKGMKEAERKGLTEYQKLTEDKLKEQNSLEWWQRFQIYIYNLLERIIPTPEDRFPYITDEPMKIWAKAFTHESFNRDFNYEQLETLGDRALEFIFSRYLIKRFPTITSEQITQLKRAYMSKGEYGKQPEIARNILKVTPYIRHLGLNITQSMYEDVFESFFGALFEISDKYVKEGTGYVNTYNMITSLFNQIGVDFTLATESDKSLVHIRFSQFGWGQKPLENVEKTPTGIKFTISLTPAAEKWFERKGLKVDPVIGEGEARTQVEAKSIAYKQANETLNSLGITSDKLEEEKEKALAKNKLLAPYLQQVMSKLREMGYVDFEFFTSKTTVVFGGYLVQLYGITSDKKKRLLRSTLATTEKSGEEYIFKSLVEE
jgi:dsRNA-specific ribonuclease